MDKKIITIGILLILVGAVVGTIGLIMFPYNPYEPPAADDTGATQEGIQEVVDANNEFAFNLLSKYMDEKKEENIFFSPYSISTALAMTYEGARGQTAEEMQSVFHFPEYEVLRPNSAAIYNNINTENKDFELMTGNALWAQKDYTFLEDYFNTVEKYYGGKAVNLDFVQETEESRQIINSFIEEQTRDKIKDLIPPGVIKPITRLVLTNAIYFKGTWEWEFDKRDTSDQDFYITEDQSIKVPMMHMDPEKATFNYLDNDELQLLELPYKGDKLSMLILLPKESFGEMQTPLTVENLVELKSQMTETKLSGIYLPKFEFDAKYFMVKDLSEMGMPTAFSMGADLSGMDGTDYLFIQQVIHQAYVKVDEKGTEAAAATAVIVGLKSAMQDNIFRADHPFIFMIQDKETGNILFMGKVIDPSK